MPGGFEPGIREEGRVSFLKERNKKLLSGPAAPPKPSAHNRESASKSFWFFFQKELLA
jgi:hypothetical protein